MPVDEGLEVGAEGLDVRAPFELHRTLLGRGGQRHTRGGSCSARPDTGVRLDPRPAPPHPAPVPGRARRGDSGTDPGRGGRFATMSDATPGPGHPSSGAAAPAARGPRRPRRRGAGHRGDAGAGRGRGAAAQRGDRHRRLGALVARGRRPATCLRWSSARAVRCSTIGRVVATRCDRYAHRRHHHHARRAGRTTRSSATTSSPPSSPGPTPDYDLEAFLALYGSTGCTAYIGMLEVAGVGRGRDGRGVRGRGRHRLGRVPRSPSCTGPG